MLDSCWFLFICCLSQITFLERLEFLMLIKVINKQKHDKAILMID